MHSVLAFHTRAHFFTHLARLLIRSSSSGQVYRYTCILCTFVLEENQLWLIPEYKVPGVRAFEPLSTHLIKDVVHPGICMLRLLLVSEMINFILGDPEADGGGEGKSKRAEKYGTKKNKERREEPLGTMSYQTSSNGRRRSLFFFVPYFSARLDFPSPPLSAPGSPRMHVL